MTAPDPRNVRDALLEAGYSPEEVERMLRAAEPCDYWLVMGQTGEYSDRSEWPVALYDSEAAAQEHVRLAQIEEARLDRAWTAEGMGGGLRSSYEFRHEWTAEQRAPWLNRYDPGAQTDYTGTDWYAIKVGPLRRPTPEPGGAPRTEAEP